MIARFGFRHLSILVGIAVSWPRAAPCAAAQQPTHWWPEQGAVILAGGGIEPPTFDAIAARLIALAGGADAPIVIIPTANEAVAPRLRGRGPAFDPTELKPLFRNEGRTPRQGPAQPRPARRGFRGVREAAQGGAWCVDSGRRRANPRKDQSCHSGAGVRVGRRDAIWFDIPDRLA
jgi:hypothetical protein